jgi:hypothetical protein
MGPGVLYDTGGREPNAVGFGAPGESLQAPPVPGTGAGRTLENPPGGPEPTPAPAGGGTPRAAVPRTPTAPRGTAAPRTSGTRAPRNSNRSRRQGGLLSRALRGVARRLRGR